MNDAFLSRYEGELAYFRESASLFAERYPKVAGRLRLDANSVEDPHVSRLIEAFAFLAARTRLKLDDEFPEVCEAMLHALYPHYLAPVPPAMMVRLSHKTPQAMENPDGFAVPRGSRLETETVQGEPCRFRTCSGVRLWPLELERVAYSLPPLSAPEPPRNFSAGGVEATLTVRIRAASEKVKLQSLRLESLRFFVSGDASTAGSVFENVLRDAVGVAVGLDKDWHFLPASCLSPGGFARDESLLPQSPRELPAYRLLGEYFCFPEKFRFIDVELGQTFRRLKDPSAVELIVYLSRSIPELERGVKDRTLMLGCTPAVNTFAQRAEPIRLNDLQTEYLVVPNARRTRMMEVLSIDRVTARTPSGMSRSYAPFYSSSHEHDVRAAEGYWYAARRPSQIAGAETDTGTDVVISLVDLHGRPAASDDWTLDVETTCLNRDLVSRLPSGERLKLTVTDGGGQVDAACVVPATPTYRRNDPRGYHWRLISQLSLNHLSLAGPEGAQSLREILRLHNPSDSPTTVGVIQSVTRVEYARESAVARVRGGPGSGLCRGVDVEIWLEPERLVGTMPYVFALVLERFFGLFATVNSFTRTRVRLERSEVPLLVGRPRTGELPLL